MSVSVRTKNPIRIKEEAAPFSSEQRSLTQTLVFEFWKSHGGDTPKLSHAWLHPERKKIVCIAKCQARKVW